MKKVIILLFSILLITGCSFIKIGEQSVDEIVDAVLTKNIKLSNNVLNGYKFYAPRGLKVIKKNKYNNKIIDKNMDLYMYVDILSYYYKIEKEYVEDDDLYYSKKLNYNNKKGYLEITKEDDKYFIEYMYNFSKIEAYAEEEELNRAILNASYVLSSVKYNDSVISTMIDENILNYKEETYDIFKSKGNEGNFLEYIEKYDKYDEKDDQTKDNDVLEFETE